MVAILESHAKAQSTQSMTQDVCFQLVRVRSDTCAPDDESSHSIWYDLCDMRSFSLGMRHLMNDLKNARLAEVDPIIAKAIDDEVARQANGLELIASENFVSEAVLEAAG